MGNNAELVGCCLVHIPQGACTWCEYLTYTTCTVGVQLKCCANDKLVILHELVNHAFCEAASKQLEGASCWLPKMRIEISMRDWYNM